MQALWVSIFYALKMMDTGNYPRITNDDNYYNWIDIIIMPLHSSIQLNKGCCKEVANSLQPKFYYYFLPIMLCCNAHKFDLRWLLCSVYIHK